MDRNSSAESGPRRSISTGSGGGAAGVSASREVISRNVIVTSRSITCAPYPRLPDALGVRLAALVTWRGRAAVTSTQFCGEWGNRQPGRFWSSRIRFKSWLPNPSEQACEHVFVWVAGGDIRRRRSGARLRPPNRCRAPSDAWGCDPPVVTIEPSRNTSSSGTYRRLTLSGTGPGVRIPHSRPPARAGDGARLDVLPRSAQTSPLRRGAEGARLRGLRPG